MGSFYFANLDKKEHIVVETGKILRLEFTTFAVFVGLGGNINTCPTDFVRITDGDGTTLLDNSCGYSDASHSSHVHHQFYFQPPIITSKTNKVEIYFHTDSNPFNSGYGLAEGWSLRWTAVAEGGYFLLS